MTAEPRGGSSGIRSSPSRRTPSSVMNVTGSIASATMPAVADLRQPSGTAFTIRDPLPWSDVAAIAREGEQLGYTAVFLPEIASRDTLATLAGLAGETEQLLLGTGVIPMAARTPKLAAMAAATVQERSGGRHILGVGTGGSVPGALDRLRAYVGELRALLDETPLSL